MAIVAGGTYLDGRQQVWNKVGVLFKKRQVKSDGYFMILDWKQSGKE